MTHLGHGAVAVVGQAVDDQRDTGRTIAFIADFLVIGAFQLAGATLDRAL
jgi:hypothetical protein